MEVASISQRARELTALLKNKKSANVFVVMLPEPLPDRQTERLLESLRELKLTPTAVFVNRILTEKESRNCPRCELTRRWQLATVSRPRADNLVHYGVPNFAGQISELSGLKKLTKRLWQIH